MKIKKENNISVQYSNPGYQTTGDGKLVKKIKTILKNSGVGKNAFLTVNFVDETEIRALNLYHRKKDKVTDVLSFSYLPDSHQDGKTILGELYICYDVMTRQAKKKKISIIDEMYFLLIHGILHLLGYDHEKTSAERRRMFQKEDEVWLSIHESGKR